MYFLSRNVFYREPYKNIPNEAFGPMGSLFLRKPIATRDFQGAGEGGGAVPPLGPPMLYLHGPSGWIILFL